MDKITFLKQDGNQWIDKDGNEIPLGYVNNRSRIEEKAVTRAVEKLIKLRDHNLKVKEQIISIINDLHDKILHEDIKGSFIAYNFNKSLKAHVKIVENYKFDPHKLDVAKKKLREFLYTLTDGSDDSDLIKIVRAMTERFNHNRVKTLISKAPEINKPLLNEFVQMYNDSRYTETKTYYSFYYLDEGEYKFIDVDYSSIQIKTPTKK